MCKYVNYTFYLRIKSTKYNQNLEHCIGEEYKGNYYQNNQLSFCIENLTDNAESSYILENPTVFEYNSENI